jgi:hypothetical protein
MKASPPAASTAARCATTPSPSPKGPQGTARPDAGDRDRGRAAGQDQARRQFRLGHHRPFVDSDRRNRRFAFFPNFRVVSGIMVLRGADNTQVLPAASG